MTALPRLPKGLAFEVADLVLIRDWADRHRFRVLIRLDHRASVDEEFEEVIAFQAEISPPYGLIMWRDAAGVFVQSLSRRKRKRYDSVAEALISLLPRPLPKERLRLTDITATTWPER